MWVQVNRQRHSRILQRPYVFFVFHFVSVLLLYNKIKALYLCQKIGEGTKYFSMSQILSIRSILRMNSVVH